jgi:hypothetical protein
VSEQQETWVELYRRALLELDPGRLPTRVQEARQAIERRLKELTPSNGNPTQLRALADALQNLRVRSRSEMGK